MPPHDPDEVFGRESGQRGLVKIWIGGNKVFGRGIDIGEVAASATRDSDFFTDRFVAFKNQNRPLSLSRFDAAHQTGSAGPNNYDVILHTRIIYFGIAVRRGLNDN